MPITDFKSAFTVKRYRFVIPSQHLDDFVHWLELRGYSQKVVERKLQGAVTFTGWATQRGLDIAHFDQLVVARFKRHLARCGSLRHPSGRYNRAYSDACTFVSFLESKGIVKSSTVCSQDDALELLEEFNGWMRTQRGTMDSTLGSYRLYVIRLLRALGTEPKDFTAKDLREFLLQQGAQFSSKTWKNMATALRMFLRFLIIRGDCPFGLDHAIPPAAQWDLASLPKYIPGDKVNQLIDSCDQSQPLGARDRAMLLLMARLGFRASDVSALKIHDLEWSQGTVLVAGKNRRQTRLPLPQDVGESILHYLTSVRPRVPSEHVFIRGVAPFTRITRQAICAAVVRSLRRTGISAPSQGTHLFRHSMATSMLRDGVSLPTIGALLRHASVQTTVVYAKVDFAALGEIAMPWPEVQP